MNDSNDPGYLEANRQAWDLRTGVHLPSLFYDVAGFKKGELSLKPPELELVGDVRGKRLLHLQCHFGLDTISWDRLGATAVGVDLSPVAIKAAQELAKETGSQATFLCRDVQAIDTFGEGFDIVFTSYGVICWLADLNAWASGIVRQLVLGGRLVLVEFHPILEVVDQGKVSGTGTYFGTRKPHVASSTGTYADRNSTISYTDHRWQHTVADVVDALLRSGLVLDDFREYPYCSYRLIEELDVYESRVWWPSRDRGRIPYMYAIVAHVAKA